jgi:hypothetical protein
MTNQNRSSAVMQQRSEPHKSLDDFPTPPWATRAVCEYLARLNRIDQGMTVREPAANRGYMARPLAEYFGTVICQDIHDYGAGYLVEDYLFGPDQAEVDWTMTNPPFRLAQQFIERALRTSRKGVAVIVRTAFLEGITRHNELFKISPPARFLQFSDRVVMHKGKIVNPNIPIEQYDRKTGEPIITPKTGLPKLAKPTSATAYCWIVWEKDHNGPTQLDWIPSRREQLERDGDYEEVKNG